MRKQLSMALCVLSTALLCACSGTPVKLGEVTDISKIDRSKGELLETSASGFQLLLFIPIGINDRHQRAYEELKNMAGPDRVLTDVAIAEWWHYAVIGTVYTSRMQAVAYPKLAAPAQQ